MKQTTKLHRFNVQSDPDKMGQAIYFYNEKVEQS